MPPKAKTRRDLAKYPALEKKYNLKSRQEVLDMDYVNELPEEWVDPLTGKKHNPKAFLNDFMNEYALADFNSNKKRVHKKKKVPHPNNKEIQELKAKLFTLVKEINKLTFNSSVSTKGKLSLRASIERIRKKIKKTLDSEIRFIKDYYKKDADDRNNRRRECILTRAKAQGKVAEMTAINEKSYGSVEDAIIELIDSSREED